MWQHGERVHEGSAAACGYLAAADEGVPSQGIIGGRTPCRAASKSPHVARRCVQDQQLRGPHCKSWQEVLTRGVPYVALAITTNGGVSLKCSQTTRYIRPTITTMYCSQRNLASQTQGERDCHCALGQEVFLTILHTRYSSGVRSANRPRPAVTRFSQSSTFLHLVAPAFEFQKTGEHSNIRFASCVPFRKAIFFF